MGYEGKNQGEMGSLGRIVNNWKSYKKGCEVTRMWKILIKSLMLKLTDANSFHYNGFGIYFPKIHIHSLTLRELAAGRKF